MAKSHSTRSIPSFPDRFGVSFVHIIGHEGYAVSSDGHIWSCKHAGCQRTYRQWFQMRPLPDRGGYCHVLLSSGPRRKRYSCHRLVAGAFCKADSIGLEVNHINGIKEDNRAENLEWVTKSQNQLHAIRSGLSHSVCGEKHGRAKLTKKEVMRVIGMDNEGLTQVDISKRTGISFWTVSRIVLGDSWGSVTGRKHAKTS